MLHSEHLRKADETYECRHDGNGNAVHIVITRTTAVIFPTINDLIKQVYFGEEVERFYCAKEFLYDLYESDSYSYHTLKEFAERVNS
jgi:hypothetical protein